jgi:hypothetical protein
MEPSMKDYVDARIGETQAILLAEIRGIDAKVQSLHTVVEERSKSIEARMLTWWGSLAQIVGVALASVGIVVGILAYGGDRFESGLGASDLVEAAEERSAGRFDERVSRIEQQLGTIIDRLPAPQPATPAAPN